MLGRGLDLKLLTGIFQEIDRVGKLLGAFCLMISSSN